MVKEEKPRGLRARLRQRRVRNSSDDEVQSRPTSLDLGRRAPAMLADGMHSMTSMPTRSDGHYFAGDGMESNSGTGGLALGEFATQGGEVAENEEYAGDRRSERSKRRAAGVKPSGAIVRSSSHDHVIGNDQPQQRQRQISQSEAKARRESSQSVPGYDSKVPGNSTRLADSHDALLSSPYQSGDEVDGSESGDSYGYSYDEESNMITNEDSEFEGDGELNAVYLKRNADFHMLFRNIPINELLIDDYGCALQRDILVQGRLYLTENFVCFYSNIFGWVTNLIIAFDEIVSIEKRMTALIIPNAIQISTLHAKHFFGSFIYRDSAYNQLYDLWAKTRNEKNAGLPEIGSTEMGDGAGDVSRHREDVVDAVYQSLSEDSYASRHRSAASVDESSDAGGDSASDAASDISAADSGSRNGSESDDSHPLSVNGRHRLHKQSSRGLGSDTTPSASSIGATEGLVSASLGDSKLHQARMLDMYAGNDGANESQTGRTAAAAQSDSNETTLTAPQTASGSTADVTLPGTTANGSQIIGSTDAAVGASATTVVGSSDAPNRLLKKLSKTSADTGASENAVNGTKHKRRKHKKPHTVQLHGPTICPCGTTGKTAHYAQEAMDAVFPLSLPLLFRVVFSATVPEDIEKMYMPSDQVDQEELDKSCTQRIIEAGNSDIKTEGWVPDPSDDGLEMCIYSYEKPLGFSIGPKSTIVEDTFRVTFKDFDRAVIVEQVAKTPNIPSGTAFFVKIRHCLTWAAGPDNLPPGGWTHYRMTFEVEWVKNSWIKSAIEKGTVDSNKQAGEMAEKYIREWITAHPSMEVKPLAHVSKALSSTTAEEAATEVVVSAHTRRRKGGRRSKRDESPRGLSMKELLQASPAAQRNQLVDSKGHEYVDGAGIGSIDVPSTNVGANAPANYAAIPTASAVEKAWADDAAVWKRRAAASWMGWLGYQLVYPLQRMLTDPIIAPVLIIALALLLFMSNMWRISLTANEQQLLAVNSASRLAEKTESMKQMQHSIDSLAIQMAELGQQIQQLLADKPAVD
ncbi:hypothetical protein H4R24_003214 [Coemansia sp. RSA 988]|nr:hypothetical protein H4R24_003214 [Coemansia sp. RSA 988]